MRSNGVTMVRPDIESLLVMGAGPIGLGLLTMAKIILGKSLPVVVADVVPYRLKMVEQLGGLPVNVVDRQFERRTSNSTDFFQWISRWTRPASRWRGRSALHSLAQRGALICVGHGEGLTLKISPDIIAPERTVVGSEYFRYNELAANLARLTGTQVVSQTDHHPLFRGG